MEKRLPGPAGNAGDDNWGCLGRDKSRSTPANQATHQERTDLIKSLLAVLAELKMLVLEYTDYVLKDCWVAAPVEQAVDNLLNGVMVMCSSGHRSGGQSPLLVQKRTSAYRTIRRRRVRSAGPIVPLLTRICCAALQRRRAESREGP